MNDVDGIDPLVFGGWLLVGILIWAAFLGLVFWVLP